MSMSMSMPSFCVITGNNYALYEILCEIVCYCPNDVIQIFFRCLSFFFFKFFSAFLNIK